MRKCLYRILWNNLIKREIKRKNNWYKKYYYNIVVVRRYDKNRTTCGILTGHRFQRLSLKIEELMCFCSILTCMFCSTCSQVSSWAVGCSIPWPPRIQNPCTTLLSRLVLLSAFPHLCLCVEWVYLFGWTRTLTFLFLTLEVKEIIFFLSFISKHTINKC